MSRQFKLSFADKILTFPGSNGHMSYDTGENKITYLETENGSISGDKEWALPDEVVTLSDTPDQDYIIDEYYVNGSAISGNTFLMPNEDVDVSARFKEAGYTITLLTDGHGTISADKLLCPIGETVNLSTTYNDYYRFNNYSVSGGTVNGNVLTPTDNCTVKANFKLNSFVASGTFQSNAANGAGKNQYTSITSYCIKKYNTDNVPSSWYDSSNRWKPNGTISGYSMTINGRFQVSAYNSSRNNAGGNWSGCILVGSNRYQNQTGQVKSGATATYSKSQTTSTTNQLYGVSGRLEGGWYTFNSSDNYTNKFVAGSTTGGSWKATGVIK